MRKFHKTAFCLLFVIVFAFLAAACTGSKKETLSPEEVQQLQEAHPQFFGLDMSDGLNILVFNGGKSGVDWTVRLVPGNKDHYDSLFLLHPSVFTGIRPATSVSPLAMRTRIS